MKDMIHMHLGRGSISFQKLKEVWKEDKLCVSWKCWWRFVEEPSALYRDAVAGKYDETEKGLFLVVMTGRD
ncbi:hypothetical protein PJI17_31655, partial [Mycobacterium kansasii]